MTATVTTPGESPATTGSSVSGGSVSASRAAAAGRTSTAADAAAASVPLVARRVYVPAVVRRTALTVATPLTAVAVAVTAAPAGPVATVTVTVSDRLASTWPAASSSATVSCSDVPAVAVVGWAVNARCVAAESSCRRSTGSTRA